MEIKTVQDLGKRSLKLYKAGQDAIERHNYGYAIELFRDILRREPAVNEIRQQLRDCQLQRIGGKPQWWRHLLAYLAVMIYSGKKTALVMQNKVGEALDNGEAAMTFDPTASPCIQLMAGTAEELDGMHICRDVLEWGIRFHPNNVRMLAWLGQVYMELTQGRKAVECFQKLQNLQPNNNTWKDMLGKAMATASIETGGWKEMEEGEADFRDGIRDKEQAARLEQSERMVKTEIGLEKLISNQEEVVAEKPTAENYRKLAEFYTEAHNYEGAVKAYNSVLEALGAEDPSIVEARAKVEDLQFLDAIHQWEEYVNNPNLTDEERANGEAELAKLRQQRQEHMHEVLQSLVNRNPTAHENRFKLGKILFEMGRYDDALEHFQYNRRNAHYRVPASIYAGRSLMEKGVYDMASEQFQSALEHAKNGSEAWKEAMYELGRCHQALGNADEATKCFKAIYAIDLRYRDVRDIVEGRQQ